MFTFGFYDSLNGDRRYNSIQMSEIFDGIIGDGVYDSIGELMAVSPVEGMSVSVGTGRAWFNHTWNKNDSSLLLDIPEADLLLARFDAVVLEVDRRNESRSNTIKVIPGTPSANPAKPALANGEDEVWQHPLAFVKVEPNSTSIAASAIENVVGTSSCPFVTGIVQTADIDVLFQQWEGEFSEWFDNIKAQLTDNVATNLQYQIDKCVKQLDKATAEDVANGTEDKWVDAAQLKVTNTTVASVQSSLTTLSTSALRVARVTFHVDDQYTFKKIPTPGMTPIMYGFPGYVWGGSSGSNANSEYDRGVLVGFLNWESEYRAYLRKGSNVQPPTPAYGSYAWYMVDMGTASSEPGFLNLKISAHSNSGLDTTFLVLGI